MFQEDCYLQLCETETGERVRKVEVTNMRVGEKYQANLKESTGLLSSPQSKSLLIWSPVPLLFEKRLDEFCNIVRSNLLTCSRYRLEYALYSLHQNKYSFPNALYDLFSGTATEEWGIYPEWSELETANFEKGFLLHGKKFHLIQLLIPSKTVSCIIQYYYKWKKIENTKYRYILGRQRKEICPSQKVNLERRPGICALRRGIEVGREGQASTDECTAPKESWSSPKSSKLLLTSQKRCVSPSSSNGCTVCDTKSLVLWQRGHNL